MLVELTRDVTAPDVMRGWTTFRPPSRRSRPDAGLRRTVLMSGNPVEREAVEAGADRVLPKAFWPASSAIKRLPETPARRTRGSLAYDAR